MDFSNEKLIEQVPRGDMRAVSRLITLVEDRVPRARTIQKALYTHTGNAHVIGVTGSPGAGKSTLVDVLAGFFIEQGKRVAILAVDPSSPFSGGSILGDRIRMNRSAANEDVYIRSMASRGSLGGMARATIEAVQILDAAGFDTIIVETVGVGQAEVDIVKTADTCMVVLVPGMGDSVQSMKAGILEIADIFAINKADHKGVDALQKDLRVLLSLVKYTREEWRPPILKTIATSGEGVAEVFEKIGKHSKWLADSKHGEKRKLRLIEELILKTASELFYEKIFDNQMEQVKSLALDCLAQKQDPYSAVEELMKKT